MKSFAEELISWWKLNGRSYPWRKSHDTYNILVAELLLHRTRADSVSPVYEEFIIEYPTLNELVMADYSSLEAMLLKLGLKWRTPLILDAARVLFNEYGGSIPIEKKLLTDIPGVGDYIASAVRVFSAGFNDPLIDVNTVRIISRVHGEKATDSTRRSKKIRCQYTQLLNDSDPRAFGYSMIDLGSLICKPRKPECFRCPVVIHCVTGASFGESSTGTKSI